MPIESSRPHHVQGPENNNPLQRLVKAIQGPALGTVSVVVLREVETRSKKRDMASWWVSLSLVRTHVCYHRVSERRQGAQIHKIGCHNTFETCRKKKETDPPSSAAACPSGASGITGLDSRLRRYRVNKSYSASATFFSSIIAQTVSRRATIWRNPLWPATAAAAHFESGREHGRDDQGVA